MKSVPTQEPQQAGEPRAPRLAEAVRGVMVLVLIGLSVLIGVGEVETARAAAVIAALLAAAIAAQLTPDMLGQLVGRISKLSIGPLAVEMVRDAAQAGRDTIGNEPDSDPAGNISMLALRLLLEAKMAFVAKHILDVGGDATYLTIGSLHYDKYLTDAQGRTASRVLTVTDELLASFPTREREAFRGEAQALVKNFRAHVFNAEVRKRLTRAGWAIAEIPRTGKSRPDLLVEKKTKRVRVVPYFAEYERSARKVLTREQAAVMPRHAVDKTVIVMPSLQRTDEIRRQSSGWLVGLNDLTSALEH